MKTTVPLFAIFVQIVANVATGALAVELVPVGNGGNAPDTRYNSIAVGSVNYDYQIGKYEVTAGQYTEFLNAVAKADPNGLYNTHMSDPGYDGAMIQRVGASPNFSYSVAPDWANRPVNYVSFWDAARFTNWLHNGQPTGPQGPTTTENGAYHDIGSLNLFGRNPGAKFFIPTEDEWYKAAYHKNDGVTGDYWNYPTASDQAPDNTLPDTENHANFEETIGGVNTFTVGSPYWRSEVGAFADSPSPYGTFDQGGNVAEWTETAVYIGWPSSLRGGGYVAGLRGGGSLGATVLQASTRDDSSPFLEAAVVGFRVAAAANAPEPSSLMLLGFGFVGVTVPRRRIA